MKTTINDIARMAGVSKATVSRVINNKPDVSKEVRNRILQIMEENNYVPSAAAQNVAGYSNKLVALIFPISLEYFLSNSHYSRMLNELIRNLDKAGYYLLLSRYSEDRYMEMVKRARVDGFITLSSQVSQSKLLEELHASGIPCVATSGLSASFVPSVDVDNFMGGKLATEHLLEMGHQKIAYIYDKNFASYEERQKGYEAALEAAGIPNRDEYIIQIKNADAEGGVEAMRQLLELPEVPTAVFACNDFVAQGVYSECEKQGLTIPNDLSVVGYDNDIESTQLNPPLTSVDQKLAERCARVVELLVEYIETEIQPSSEILEAELVIRESVKRITRE